MKFFDVDNPRWRVVLAYPVHSILENPPRGWLAGIGIAVLQWVIANKVVWIALAMAFLLGFVDQRAGEKLARRNAEHDPMKADAGLYGKLLGIALVIGLWPFEVIIIGFGGPDLHGMLPTAAAVWIAWHEYESIHEKYQQFGRPPIPVIAQIAALLKRLSDAIFQTGANR